jgi:hypothetical protein
MERINLTLDVDTSSALDKHARKQGKARATVARELIREALAQRRVTEVRRKMARDYAAGRADASDILRDLESPQLELLDQA